MPDTSTLLDTPQPHCDLLIVVFEWREQRKPPKARWPWAQFFASWYLNPLTPYRTQTCPCTLETCPALTEPNEWNPHASETHNKWELKDYLVTSLGMLGLFQNKLEETMVSPSGKNLSPPVEGSPIFCLMTNIKKKKLLEILPRWVWSCLWQFDNLKCLRAWLESCILIVSTAVRHTYVQLT